MTSDPRRSARPTGTYDPLSLDVDRWRFTLRLTRGIRCHFAHGALVGGVIRAALGMHDLPIEIIPAACESGGVRFAKGDRYRLGVTLVGAARSAAPLLRAGLQRLGLGELTPAVDRPGVLRGNFAVERAERLPAPPLADLLRHLELASSVTLRFTSPLRLKRPPAMDGSRAKFVNEHCFPADHFLHALGGRLVALAGARPAAAPPRALRARAHPGHLLWLDTPVADRPGGTAPRAGAPRGYTHGGVLGTVRFDQVPPEWLPWLLMGRYVHAGEHPAFGLGRYHIIECEPWDPEPFTPASSVWARAIARPTLSAAETHVREDSSDADTDPVVDETGDDFDPDLVHALESGSYRPGPLYGRLIGKPGGEVRPLAVPGVRDRIVQRAVVDALTPALDTLLEDCSHGYRRGRSRAGAAEDIQRAYRDGYRWVLDADISAFFDSVRWPRLFAKLHALYPFDPVVSIIERWVCAPVIFEGHRILRTQGLPQGMPLSPLLANLFLDEFDEALLDQNFRLVRFADDFVVLCRDPASAALARDEAREALARMGLTLHEAKTEVRSVDHGFSYLGYLFCRSVVIEKKTGEPLDTPDEDLAVPSASWLAQVPLKALKTVRPGRAPQRASPDDIARPIFTARDAREGRRPVYVSQHTTSLSLLNGALILERRGHPHVRCPIEQISHVTIVGRARATMPLLQSLGRDGVPVYLCSPSGELEAVIEPHAPSWGVWLAQARVVEDRTRCRTFARALVRAKLRNYAAISTRFRLVGADGTSPSAAMRALAVKATEAQDMDELRGLEGRGAALYFGAMQASLPPFWGFAGRRRNPPPDPVNSLLSLGYTLLYNHASTALFAAGLNPRMGLFHREHGTHHALASDLMEPFRHLIDRLVWALVHRREVAPEDFVRPSDGRGCFLGDALRRDFVQAVDERLHETFTPPDGVEQSYRQYLDVQARQIRAFVDGASAYHPFEEHA